VISLQDQECGDLILTTAKSSIYSTKPFFVGINVGTIMTTDKNSLLNHENIYMFDSCRDHKAVYLPLSPQSPLPSPDLKTSCVIKMMYTPVSQSGTASRIKGIIADTIYSILETNMTKLTLQEQMLKAGLVNSKKLAKVQKTAKKSRVQAREAREAVEVNKKAQVERDKQLSEQQKQAALSKEYKAQVKQLIEMNRIVISKGNISYNFTDNNLIKNINVDKTTQAQLINGRLAIARLVADNGVDNEYAIIPAVVADKIAQRDASSIVLNAALSQEAQDEEDPYADFVVPDDLMW
jgi:hypothetical protein